MKQLYTADMGFNMGKRIVIANWKSHKTEKETLVFLDTFKSRLPEVNLSEKEIILCPSFPSLPACAGFVRRHNLPVSLGAQTVSSFAEGAYTGEVSARQIKEFVAYVIIGHSERRKNQYETDSEIAEKIKRAKEEGLTTILCIQDEKSDIPQDADFVAYEPIFAIGTGTPDTPDNISSVFTRIFEKTRRNALIYGGSVDAKNVASFLAVPYLCGFLVGTASLDPDSFIHLLAQC